MRKILLFLFFVTMVGTFAQNKSTQSKSSSDSISYFINVLHYPKCILFDGNDIEFYKSPDDAFSTNTLDKYEDCYIIGDNDTKYLCTSYGKAFWVNKKDVPLSQDSIHNLLHNKCVAYSKCLVNIGKSNSLSNVIDLCERHLALYRKYPIIIHSEIYDEDEDLETASFSITIDNDLKKTVKYAYVTIRGYNAVNDPVGHSQTVTCIGPIKFRDAASYEFKNIWWTDIIEKVKIIGLKLKFMDNTYRIIPHPERYRCPGDLEYDTDYMDKLDSCISVSKVSEFE